MLRPLLVGLAILGYFPIGVCSEALGPEFDRRQSLAISQAAIGQRMTNVTLVNTSGESVQFSQLAGRPLVISLIFTSCHHVCPTTTQSLREAVRKARTVFGEDGFSVISIGFDVEQDTPSRMAQFRDGNGVIDPTWHFLSGDKEQIEILVQQLGFVFYPSPRGFDHLVQTSVIDADGVIYRQLYGMIVTAPQLMEPLKELIFGQARNTSVVDYLSNRIRLFCTVYDPARDNYYIDVSVFIGTGVGLIVCVVFGLVLIKEWRKSLKEAP